MKTNQRKTNWYESTKSLCSSAFAFLLIRSSAYLHICIPKKIGTSRSLSRFFRGSALLTLLTFNCFANNVTITNVAYTSPNVTFCISWENSWYTTSAPNNWDAVWVFVKYQACTGTATPFISTWTHATLDNTGATPYPTNHWLNCTGSCGSSCPGVGMRMDTVQDGKGIFIRRSAAGFGQTYPWTCNVKLSAPPATGSVNVKVFGIEMVFIPGASTEYGAGTPFTIGDGGTGTNPFTNQSISSEGALAGGLLYAGSPAVPASYPKGYRAFYCMKHEVSQQQYCDFLNTCQFLEQKDRTRMSPDSFANFFVMGTPASATVPVNRNGIKVTTVGLNYYTPSVYGMDLNGDGAYNGLADGQYLPCNFLAWQDLCAFLDWAALRPMTELEYEKICRGTLASVANEYPWGDASNLTSVTSNSLSNAGTVNELASPTAYVAGWCAYNGSATWGPVREGASAGSTTGRIQAAAGYYGVLDLAGNLWEQVVAVDATGVNFTGQLGDGALVGFALPLPASGYEGNANTSCNCWPGTDGTPARGVTGATGSGARGGSWATTNAAQLRTSDRTNATNSTSTRNMEYGGRGVRQK